MGRKKQDAEQPGETSQPKSFFPSIKMLHREESGTTGNH